MGNFDFHIDDMLDIKPKKVTYKEVLAEASNFVNNYKIFQTCTEQHKKALIAGYVGAIYIREAERHERVNNTDYSKKLRRRSNHAYNKMSALIQGK